MMKPNIRPMLRGSKLVPSTRPRPAMAMQASGTRVRMIHQCSDRWACTPGACTTEAIGSTMIGRDHALGRAGQHLGDRHQPDRAGRLDPVLDLPGEAELLGHGQRDRLDALEHDRDADHAGHQDGGERGLGRRAVAAADALADLREHEQEHEAEQERLDERAQHELPQVLAQHDQVAQQQRAQRGPARGGDRPGRPAADPPAWAPAGSARWPSVPQLLAGQVDEHGLQAGLGDRQVDQVEAAALGGQHDPRHEPVAALHVQLDPAVDRPGPGDAGHLAG